MDKLLFVKMLIAAETARITSSEFRFRHFLDKLREEEIYIIYKDNVQVLSRDGYFSDGIEAIGMNGEMVQINLKTKLE